MLAGCFFVLLWGDETERTELTDTLEIAMQQDPQRGGTIPMTRAPGRPGGFVLPVTLGRRFLNSFTLSRNARVTAAPGKVRSHPPGAATEH